MAGAWRMRGCLVALSLILLSIAPSAGAHAIFVEATPSNGAVVDQAPDRVEIAYNEPIDRIHVLDLLNTSGARVQPAPAMVDPANASRVLLPTGNLSDGLYTVRWAVAAGDLHNVSGAFFFLVGDELPSRQALRDQAAASRPGQPTMAAEELVPRGLAYMGLALTLGLPAAGAWLTRSRQVKEAWPSRREGHLTAVACVLASGGLVSLAWVRGQPLSSPAILGPAGLLTFAGGLSYARPTRGLVRGLVVAAGFVGAWSLAITSHSASLVPGAWGLAVDLAHLAAGGLWAGSLVGLWSVVSRLDLEGTEGAPAARAVLAASSLAALAAGLAIAAGLWLASWHVGSLRDLATTVYGALVSVKSLLVVSALALAGVSRLVLYHRAKRRSEGVERQLSASVAAEALVLAGVLLLSAGLSAGATAASLPDGSGALEVERTATFQFMGELDGEQVSIPVRVDLTVVPASVGLNAFDVRVTHEGQPVPEIEDVQLAARNAAAAVELPGSPLSPQSDGLWSGVSALPLAGTWGIEVSFFLDDEYQAEAWTLTVQELGAGPSGLADGGLVTPLRLAGGVVLVAGAWLALSDLRRLPKG